MTKTIAEVLADGSSRLSAAQGQDVKRESRILLASVLKIDASDISLRLEDPVSDAAYDVFMGFVDQRSQSQPIAQIIGKRAFWTHEFIVTPAVLDPRPDTETLIEAALSGPIPKRILDMGTGSGCIVVTLLSELNHATAIATDISKDALDIAQKNANNIGVSDRVECVQSDWFTNVDETFDLIVSNPPYISALELETLDADVKDWEPSLALSPGGDGLDAYRIIASGLDAHLNLNGRALFEIGASQAADVQEIFRNCGFYKISTHKDINGKDRVVSIFK
jgi:release factor glutamine methyltransferase